MLTPTAPSPSAPTGTITTGAPAFTWSAVSGATWYDLVVTNAGGTVADQWYASIGDNTLADAILDRLMHNAHRLPLNGESMRKTLGKLTEDEHLM